MPADGYHLAWHMGLPALRYLLVPTDLDDVNGEARLESVREDGVPTAPIFVRKGHICSLRRPDTADGEECPQERELVGEFLDKYRKGRDLDDDEPEGDFFPPKIVLTTRMPAWSGWR
jgi:hypothetical protein